MDNQVELPKPNLQYNSALSIPFHLSLVADRRTNLTTRIPPTTLLRVSWLTPYSPNPLMIIGKDNFSCGPMGSFVNDVTVTGEGPMIL